MSTIIAVDHGYGMIKTVNTAMITGVSVFDYEPFSLKHTLKLNGKYYVCGTSRQSLIRDKTCNENYYWLTLAAIAEELKFRQCASSHVDVVLAAGLPLTQFGREKDSFKAYLSRMSQPVNFEYEGTHCSVSIRDVLLYPQGYSAYVTHTESLRKDVSLVLADCGSWTLDVMRIDNGVPDADSCRSLELGLIRCINEISEQIRRNLGYSVTEAQIEQILRMEGGDLENEAQDIILEHGQRYITKLFNTLMECGLDAHTTPIVFMGGGATLVKNFAPSIAKATYIEGIHANAKGYERIAKQVLRNAKAAV